MNNVSCDSPVHPRRIQRQLLFMALVHVDRATRDDVIDSHRDDKVKKRMHLHQVVLYWCAADDDLQSHWDQVHLLSQNRFGIFQLVTLQNNMLYNTKMSTVSKRLHRWRMANSI